VVAADGENDLDLLGQGERTKAAVALTYQRWTSTGPAGRRQVLSGEPARSAISCAPAELQWENRRIAPFHLHFRRARPPAAGASARAPAELVDKKLTRLFLASLKRRRNA
jgi:hypothetical protein